MTYIMKAETIIISQILQDDKDMQYIPTLINKTCVRTQHQIALSIRTPHVHTTMHTYLPTAPQVVNHEPNS